MRLHKDEVIAKVTNPLSRKHLYHFTRVKNLPAIAHFDSLMSSYTLNPHLTGERRTEPKAIHYREHSATINAHLRIPDSMMDPACTQEEFRAYLDRHVFFWPTVKDCQKMLDTYSRREPDSAFAVLELKANTLLSDHYDSVKLSKYDSGSSPRFPKHCGYKKSSSMFLPLDDFSTVKNSTQPATASEIKEVLVEDRVTHLSAYLESIYVKEPQELVETWRKLMIPLKERFVT